ncbi:ATP-binding protein [Promicromonospora sp. NPDC023987]|uniref:ATP-binding protein n=1 Tax=Promicromonospora sp. NPDC023987 TaxID=3155360 RepID=UPI0033C4BC62
MFGDDVIAAATIDRLVHHAEAITLDGESSRTPLPQNSAAVDNLSSRCGWRADAVGVER